MICPPCADAADGRSADLLLVAIGHPLAELIDFAHDPAICRDHAVQPAGCPCAHRPAGTASPKEYTRA